MKKCIGFIIFCQFFFCWFWPLPSRAEEKKVQPQKKFIRSVALKPSALNGSPHWTPLQTPAAAVVRTNAASSGVMIAQEVGRQRLELTPHWYLEGDYNYFRGWSNRNQWVMLDKPEVYVVYQFYPFDLITPYVRFGADWLRQQDHYLQTNINRNGDTVGLHGGGGLRFGFTKHMALDFDVRYAVSSGNNKNRGDNWGGRGGVLFYF